MSTAIAEILAERYRQISMEGWSHEHDDQHQQGELACAAACYAAKAEDQQQDRPTLDGFPPGFWPWDEAWWKPADARRNLVKASALLLAEIERLDRAEAKAAPASEPEEAWSIDGENYHFNSLQELLDNSSAMPGSTVYVGTKSPFAPSCFVESDAVVEQMADRAADEAGEFAQDFPDPSQGARDQLSILLAAWADLHCSADFFLIEGAREYVLADNTQEA